MYVVTPQVSGGSSDTSVKVATGTFKLLDESIVDVGFRPRAVLGSYGGYYAFAFEEKRPGGGC